MEAKFPTPTGHVYAARLMIKGRPSVLVDFQRSTSVTDEAMSTLAEAFHLLRGAPGVRPWEPDRLYCYAFSAAASEATRDAIRFVLDVYNGRTIETLDDERFAELPSDRDPLGNFRCVEALGRWDAGNREAFLAWVEDPWWP